MPYSPLLPVHITGGILGILSGAAAMSFRKGSPRHFLAGKVFVIAMLTMADSATYLAAMKHQVNNLFGGPLTFYLVGTAWWTARRKDGETGTFDWVALLVALGIGAGILTLGLKVAYSQAPPPGGVPAGMYFFMSSVALLAGVGDIRMLVRRGVLGTKRIVRHLWRMCFALFIATGSFFLGQGSKVFPAFMIKSNVLFVPAILPLLLLIFWLVRVRFPNAYKGKSMPHGGDISAAGTQLSTAPSRKT